MYPRFMMRAVKTEYRNVVFRSKSEAIFARCLDLAGSAWQYEPKDAIHQCKHRWDFIVCIQDKYPIYLEYKPSEPTRTYVSNLHNSVRKHWESLYKRRSKKDNFDPTRFYDECPRYLLVYGSHFDPPPEGFDTYAVYPIWDKTHEHGLDFCQAGDNGEKFLHSVGHSMFEDFGITERIIKEASQYRFDLKGS